MAKLMSAEAKDFPTDQNILFSLFGDGDGLGHERDFAEMSPMERADDTVVLDQVLASPSEHRTEGETKRYGGSLLFS